MALLKLVEARSASASNRVAGARKKKEKERKKRKKEEEEEEERRRWWHWRCADGSVGGGLVAQKW
ncbi:hypothetical protein JCGZ_18317 [Jatropha curcas]|uniref:Uncharacterized protein n=1 Tax=Jatropha curcas TaxID=180498 RepID=A0A067JZJ2_JATCU|nr:hypothetical protein JCGZ_18317 [Jatropha curcas]